MPVSLQALLKWMTQKRFVGLMVPILLCACKPARYDIYDDFEAEAGMDFHECGYVVANPPLGECLADEDVLDVDEDRLGCLKAAWEQCEPAVLDGRFRLESGEFADTRTYVSPSPEGGCKIVDFSYAGEDELLRSECGAITFFPATCHALEMSECVVVDRIPVRPPGQYH